MIKPTCVMCEEELEDFGGIILSEPRDMMWTGSESFGRLGDVVDKAHLCKPCLEKVIEFIQNNK